MPHLVVKNNISAGGALAVGQTLRLGSFIMTDRSAAAPTMTSRVIENNLHVGSEFAEQMGPMELSSLNQVLDSCYNFPLSSLFEQSPRFECMK